MPEIKLREPDEDLIPLIRRCTTDELDNLVGYITKKGGVSCQLKYTKSYKSHCPEHKMYADEIAAELQKFGGNTLFNIMRKGRGVSYRGIVCDVASRLKVEFSKDDDIESIEQQILLKVLEISWGKMSDSEKSALLKGIMADTGVNSLPGEFPAALIRAAIIAGGTVVSYQLYLLVASAIARLTLERGVMVAASTVMSRWVSIFAGAVGLGITAVWTVFDVSGPAYRVTVPCVLHIAMLRQLHRLRESGIDPEQALPGL